jgi:hypothetical protein
MHTKLWSENLKGRDYSEGLSVDGRITFNGEVKVTKHHG